MAPDRLVLVYLVGIGCLLLALLGVLWTRDPVVPTGRWRLQRPSVPANVAGRFARAGLSGAVGWSVGALFLSVVPSYASLLLHTGDLALLGAIRGLMLIASGTAQVILLRLDLQPRLAQPAGLVALGLGIGLLVLAFPLHSLVVLVAAAVLAGFGLGFALFGAQKDVNQLAPARRRGEVTAAFITCLYGGAALAAITVGLLADAYGLSTAVAISGGVLAAVAAATTIWHVVAEAPLAERLEEVT